MADEYHCRRIQALSLEPSGEELGDGINALRNQILATFGPARRAFQCSRPCSVVPGAR